MILNKEIVDNHKQLSEYSCIPMAVELVLKLLEHAPSDYFELQTQWNNSKAGSFANFDGQTIKGVTFHHQFSVANGRCFPPEKMKQLFDTIDHELQEGRYVVVSLAHGNNWHNFVVYDQMADGEYQAASKAGSDTWCRSDVKQIITEMTGTDILTYEVSKEAAT